MAKVEGVEGSFPKASNFLTPPSFGDLRKEPSTPSTPSTPLPFYYTTTLLYYSTIYYYILLYTYYILLYYYYFLTTFSFALHS